MLKVFTKIGFVLLLFLLIINIYAYIIFETASEPISFTSLLDQLDNAPTVKLTIVEIADNMKITANWGAFNWFREFINYFAYALSFIVWIGTLFYNLTIMIGYILYLLGVQGFSALT